MGVVIPLGPQCVCVPENGNCAAEGREEKRRREKAEIRHIYKRGNKCLHLVLNENQYVQEQSDLLTAFCDRLAKSCWLIAYRDWLKSMLQVW